MTDISTLGRTVARYREMRGLTLTGLAQRCGVAKSALSRLENGQSNPTVETLWAIANALEVPFSQLASGAQTPAPLHEEGVVVRFIERTEADDGPRVETYSMTIDAGHTKMSAAHPPGVSEKVVVITGPVLAGTTHSPKRLGTGDVHAFAADVPHIYAAPERRAQLMVFVEYPAPDCAEPDQAVVLDWPATDGDWDGVRSVVDRLLIEVANGVAASLLRFRHCALAADAARHALQVHALPEPSRWNWPVTALVGHDAAGPYVAVLAQHACGAFLGTTARHLPDDSMLSRARQLSRLAETPYAAPPVAEEGTDASSWVMEALRCEVAIQRGTLTLPRQLHHLATRDRAPAPRPNATREDAFSSRIDVDHYDAFELLHPAYARQVVALAEDVLEFAPSGAALQTIDIGTGPGIPLLMLHELLPGLSTLAVEPDEVAFACLRENTRGVEGIALHQGGFLELDAPQGQATLLTSVGASHHFNTAFMLQQAMQLLRPGGLLAVADEFLPPFDSPAQRNAALVRHHAAYIVAAVAWLGRCGVDIPDDEDGRLYRAFQHTMALALFDADQGRVPSATRQCRGLFTRLRQSALHKRPGHAVGAYVRFFWLELQAMVAGFDYEVERKTYARRFVELAQLAGFELMRHRRVFATTGGDDWSGGTHVITLRKPAA